MQNPLRPRNKRNRSQLAKIFIIGIIALLSLMLIPLLGLYSACAIKNCFVHFANATFTTAVVLCSVPCSSCPSASRHRHYTSAHACKKKVTTFCDLNNNLGRRFWDSLYMHDIITCQVCNISKFIL